MPFDFEADRVNAAMHGYERATCPGGPVWIAGVRYEVPADHRVVEGLKYCPHCGWRLGVAYDA